jgi:hypothetical protein
MNNILYRTLLITGLLALTACSENDTQKPAAEVAQLGAGGDPIEWAVTTPRWAADTAWLDLRKSQQLSTIAGSKVFHDFQLNDEQPGSGITFRNQVVDDAAIAYKGVHYDHGTAIAAADVDNDGRIDLYFPNQVGSNELWRNLGNGRFENITTAAGVGIADRISVGASFADTDNDGDQDLFVTTVRGGNILFENDGKGVFVDISAEAGVGYVGHSSGALFVDVNNDGLLDLYVANIGEYTTDAIGPDNYFVGHKDAFSGHTMPEREETSILYLNNGGNRFSDVTAEFGISHTRWSGDIAAIDGNNDGYMDIYVLNMQGLDGYYENQQGKGFIDKSADTFPQTSWGAMGVQVFDFDNDGDQDIYVTDMHSDMADQLVPTLAEEKRKALQPKYSEEFFKDGGNGIFGNTFFRNEGNGTFTEVSDDINAENFWPWGLSAGDLNADGFQDVFIASSMNYPWRYGINSVLLNESGGQFVDAEFALGVEPRRPREEGRDFLPWFDIDCAGANVGHRDCPSIINAGKVHVKGAYGSRSSVMFDIEGDGDLDVVTSEFGSEPLVLVNNISEKINVRSLSVELIGTQSNRNGFGATVIVTAGGSSYTQVMTGKTGYLGQSVTPLYFGLGDSVSVDSIEVRWPSGTVQTMQGPIKPGNVRINEQG